MSTQDRPTYAEISKHAGVSQATVSRVLNGDERVHPDRTKRVLESVAALGYRKNRAASALASGRTGLIAVVIDDDMRVFNDPFWSAVSSGVSRVLQTDELQTLLMVSNMTSPSGAIAHYLNSGDVDGAIFFQLHSEEFVSQLAARGLPVVIAGTPLSSADFTYVDSDNFGGARQATHHLLQRGCKSIATITGDINASAARQRLDGYRQGVRDYGHVANNDLVAYGDYSYESGQEQMRVLLSRGVAIDGVFAANDLMAVGAMAALEEAGRKIPEDVAVVGFDDSLIAQTTRPALTTIRQDIMGLGEAVAELMIQKLSGEETFSRILPTELIVRDSA